MSLSSVVGLARVGHIDFRLTVHEGTVYLLPLSPPDKQSKSFNPWIHSHGADEKILGALIGLRPAALHRIPFELVKRVVSEQSEEIYRMPTNALQAWLCKELKIDFAKEWKPSVEFIEQFQGDDRKGLLEEGDFVCDIAAKPEAILAAWPAGFVPRELLEVDREGKISGKKKSKTKKRG